MKEAYDKIKEGLEEAKDWLSKACFCVGPQNGQSKCPCQLQYEAQDAIEGRTRFIRPSVKRSKGE